MSFATSLRQEAQSIFDSIWQHPFVQGLAKGELPREVIIHYVQQDTQYLNTYCKVYGMALAKAHTQAQMRAFYERIGLLLDGELVPHQNLCQVAGASYEAVRQKAAELAPTAHHYARHMLSVAQQGTLGEIVAVVLPCHWIYVDIAKQIVDESHPAANHPFYDWISFYASDRMQAGLNELITMLDELAASSGELDSYLMKSAFLDSCRLEYQFFDMAYKLERWEPTPRTLPDIPPLPDADRVLERRDRPNDASLSDTRGLSDTRSLPALGGSRDV
ncbi:thiaminase II [Alicyclobacillus cycloheptanicus]|uniref:Aminopyrimidine aminohydrolase n=1 Tax=Alicyclobacillus cycloheptanicus TaxID=1457 RepID=A0ABT9XLQ0_9BACL|nr:thiaminase II [Alicyclobacillus cycloheptanicus]MDQ0190683.1 thiaminase/transcriptional activator TenA [Alicyclobacillus cycloheptanicus]WDM00302.1 thiaminase II [Alicyclobacillus cycloheptanicus]